MSSPGLKTAFSVPKIGSDVFFANPLKCYSAKSTSC